MLAAASRTDLTRRDPFARPRHVLRRREDRPDRAAGMTMEEHASVLAFRDGHAGPLVIMGRTSCQMAVAARAGVRQLLQDFL